MRRRSPILMCVLFFFLFVGCGGGDLEPEPAGGVAKGESESQPATEADFACCCIRGRVCVYTPRLYCQAKAEEAGVLYQIVDKKQSKPCKQETVTWVIEI